VGVEGDPVDDRGDQAGVGEDGAPFAEWQVGLAGAAVAEEHDRLAFVQVGARCQAGELSGSQGGNRVSVEVGQPFEAREAGFGDAAGAAPGGAVGELGGQDLGEVGQVGGVFPGGDLGQPGGLVADGGQLELAGRGADGGLGGGIGGGGHGMVLVSRWPQASRAGAGRS